MASSGDWILYCTWTLHYSQWSMVLLVSFSLVGMKYYANPRLTYIYISMSLKVKRLEQEQKEKMGKKQQ